MFRARRRLAAIGTGIALAVAASAPGRPRPRPPPRAGARDPPRLPHPPDRRRRSDRGSEVHGGGGPDPVREVRRMGVDSELRGAPHRPGRLSARFRRLDRDPPAARLRRRPRRRSTSPPARALRSAPRRSARRAPRCASARPRARSPCRARTSSGSLRVPAPPAQPEAWITLWGAEDGDGGAASTRRSTRAPPPTPPPALSDRPHLLQLANGVVIQVDGFWLEAGEIRFRRLGGVVGFALGEIARLLPQEVESVRGRLAARFVRRLGPDRARGPPRRGAQARPADRRRAGGPGSTEDPGLDDPWAGLDRGLLVHLEFDRERSGAEGDWLAYVYLPNGRMLNAELIRVGLARPRSDGRNLRYLDLFEELVRKDAPPPPAP